MPQHMHSKIYKKNNFLEKAEIKKDRALIHKMIEGNVPASDDKNTAKILSGKIPIDLIHILLNHA